MIGACSAASNATTGQRLLLTRLCAVLCSAEVRQIGVLRSKAAIMHAMHCGPKQALAENLRVV